MVAHHWKWVGVIFVIFSVICATDGFLSVVSYCALHFLPWCLTQSIDPMTDKILNVPIHRWVIFYPEEGVHSNCTTRGYTWNGNEVSREDGPSSNLQRYPRNPPNPGNTKRVGNENVVEPWRAIQWANGWAPLGRSPKLKLFQLFIFYQLCI